MTKYIVITLFVLCILSAGCATGPRLTALEGMPADAPVTTVSIQGENCEWIPDRITVNKGSHVVLNVNSVDWNYNFRLKNYELLFHIPQGETVSAEFYAAEPGEFEFGCYIEEGRNYYWGGMVGKLIVE